MSTSSQLSDSDEDIRELLTDVNSDESNVDKPPSSKTREGKFLDEQAHEFEQEEKTTSPIATNSRTLSTSDGRQNSQILSSITEWENIRELLTDVNSD